MINPFWEKANQQYQFMSENRNEIKLKKGKISIEIYFL